MPPIRCVDVAVLLLLLTALVATARGHGSDDDDDDDDDDDTSSSVTVYGCASVADCPRADTCYAAECTESVCVYDRLPFDECCLDSAECCEYVAGPFQTMICDVAHRCQPGTCLQCIRDEDCDGLVSSDACLEQGDCFRPSCDAGLCQCFNGTGIDLDHDGVPCPDDCDDRDDSVSRLVTCVPDADGDGFPPCGSNSCIKFCVEHNATCPVGYVDLDDLERDERPRSLRTDLDFPCELDDEESAPSADSCDCCDIDPLAFPGSWYASGHVTACDDYQYGCRDNGVEYQVCCGDGELVGDRYIWDIADCEIAIGGDLAAAGECGGCSDTGTANIGWSCETECTEETGLSSSVPPGTCPAGCHNACACISEDVSPVPGVCGNYVDSCLQVRPGIWGDHEDCCILTAH